MWVLEKEDDTGKLRFRSTVNGEITYEMPMNLILDQEEEKIWDEYQK